MSLMSCSKIVKFSVLLLLAWAMSAPAVHADDWPIIVKKTKSKYAKYHKDIQDMTMLQEIVVTMQGLEITSEATMMKKGAKFRVETVFMMPGMPEEMGPMKIIVINEGEDAWMISSMMGKHKILGEEKKQYEMAGDWWRSIPENATSVETEKIGDHDCHVAEFESDHAGPFTKMWIDKKDFVLVKAESTTPDGKLLVMTCSDFRKFEKDWKMPYKTEITMDGELVSTSLVKSIEINNNLSDELFDHEKAEVKGPNMEEMIKMMQEQGE